MSLPFCQVLLESQGAPWVHQVPLNQVHPFPLVLLGGQDGPGKQNKERRGECMCILHFQVYSLVGHEVQLDLDVLDPPCLP